jgi:hypothetical protein
VHPQIGNQPIAVVGATGHTGRFVVAELTRECLRPVAIGRSAQTLAALGRAYPTSETRLASIDDRASLDKALAGCAAVINCAGPFLDTALPVVDAALRARIPYLDVTAEQSAMQLVRTRDADARRAGVVLVPGAAFYGGLADVLATAAAGDASEIDEIAVAVALDRWHPTKGTRLTGARNTARRLIVQDGLLQAIPDPPPTASWTFPAPFGEQGVSMLPLSETIALFYHLRPTKIESWIDQAALRDVHDPATPAPEASDERGRSSQRFVMDVHVRVHRECRRATAYGRDIYAVTAPIVVGATLSLLAGLDSTTAGVRSLGEITGASAFLEALARDGNVRVEYGRCRVTAPAPTGVR